MAVAVATAAAAAARAQAPADGGASVEVSDGAASDDDAETLAKAREAFRLGTALARQGQWSEALAAYERSQSLHRHAATTYNIGFCMRALGRYTMARTVFERALEEGEARPGELAPNLEADAIAFLRELEGKIVRLTVTVNGVSAEMTVDGRPLEEREPGSFVAGVREPGPAEPVPSLLTLALDPGEHTLVVIQEGESAVQVVRYEAGNVEQLVLGREAPTVGPSPPDYRPAAYVAWGLAGAALISGVVSGSIALATRSGLDERCDADRVCPDEDAGAIKRMQHSADVATTSFVVAGAGAVLGTVIFFLSPHDDLALDVGPTGARVRVRF